jgi:hypothetical protein
MHRNMSILMFYSFKTHPIFVIIKTGLSKIRAEKERVKFIVNDRVYKQTFFVGERNFDLF